MTPSKPTVLILAAGANSRFFPFNYTAHKGMITLLGESLLNRTLNLYVKKGFSRFVIIHSPRESEAIRTHVTLPDSVECHYVEQPEPKGMGDAVLCAKELIGRENFIVMFPNGFDTSQAIVHLLAAGAPPLLCASHTKEPWLYGILSVEDGKATAIVEKPQPGSEPSNLKVEGLYFLNQRFMEILHGLPEAEYNFEEALATLMREAPVAVVQLESELFSLKFPWQLFAAQEVLFQTVESSTHPDVFIPKTVVIDDTHGPVVIEAGARIGDFVKIVGPVYLGKNVLIGDYSFVRQSSVEAGATIGANTEVVRSIIMEDATVHFGYLADSIIGREVKIGAGLITANRRHDRENVKMNVKGQKVNTGMNGLGAMIGDRTKIGVRTTTIPGVAIGADCVLYPSLTVYENVGHGEVVKGVRK